MRLRPEELASREAMIFKDPIFMKSSTWVLSTSMLVSEHFVGSGYGQVTDAGYGSAYVYLDITSRHICFDLTMTEYHISVYCVYLM